MIVPFVGPNLRYFLYFATIVSGLLIWLYFSTIHGEAYREAERFVMTNPDVLKHTGTSSRVGLKFWSGFDVTYAGSGGEASFVLETQGREENFTLDVRMTRVADSWIVREAYISSKKLKGVQIELSRPPGSGVAGP